MNKNLMRQAQMLQKRLTQAQEEIRQATVEGSAGGGAVKVILSGTYEVSNVTIAKEALEDTEMLGEMVMVAFNDAVKKLQDLQQQKMSAITGGMNIPGLM